MKIDFDILWVDDNQDFVDSLKPRLEKWMAEHGLGLRVFWHAGAAGVLADLKVKDISLIVLDYQLRGNKNGDQIILDIREKGFYEDIVFYTTGSNPNTLFEVAPDGVFFVPRADAINRIKDLLTLKIRRASDLSTLRGWIVADSIELESMMGKILAKCFGEMETLFETRVLSEDGIFDFGKKHKVLNGILKDRIAKLTEAPDDLELANNLRSRKRVLDSFPKEIIEIRNALAHQMAIVTDTGHRKVKTKTKEAKDIIITLERCIEIRRDIRKHFDNLSALKDLV